LEIEDSSGGCGTFFKIAVASTAFEGKTRVAQHRMVNDLLKEELKSMHGMSLSTSIPKDAEQKL
jgi:stress-induced morphogen